jgi:hypothetical protein
MGHSAIQMTFDAYAHLFPSADDDQVAMSQLQARLDGEPCVNRSASRN